MPPPREEAQRVRPSTGGDSLLSASQAQLVKLQGTGDGKTEGDQEMNLRDNGQDLSLACPIGCGEAGGAAEASGGLLPQQKWTWGSLSPPPTCSEAFHTGRVSGQGLSQVPPADGERTKRQGKDLGA